MIVLQIVPKESSRLNLPGDRENIVPLNADHSGVSKFGVTQTDQDNLTLVQRYVRKLYENALKCSELNIIPSAIPQGQGAGHVDDDEDLNERFAKLKGGLS